MYGFIYNTLRNLVILHFNEEIWLEICEEAGIEELKDGILDRHYYEESYLATMGVTASKRLDLPLETILELFGGFFFVTCKRSGHSSMLRTLGHNLYGFLMNLDSLHDHLAVTFDLMAAPSFRCEKTRTSVTLHYYTQRGGLSTIVKGIVKAVAEDFYKLDIAIEQTMYEQLDEKLAHHYVFYIECTDSPKNTGNYLERLTGDLDAAMDASMLPEVSDEDEEEGSLEGIQFNISQDAPKMCPVAATMSVPDLKMLQIPNIAVLDNMDKDHISKTVLSPNTKDQIKELLTRSTTNVADATNSRAHSPSSEMSLWPVKPGLFQTCFPFHIIFDKDLVIKYMGISFMRIFPKAVSTRAKLSDYFVLNRPAISLTYSNIMLAIHNIFIISANKASSKSESEEVVPFRGQMVPTTNKEGSDILFIGSPRVNSIEDLEHQGLYLSDIPVHDVTRDLILLNQHFHVERNTAAELQEMKRDLEIQKNSVERERLRADTLLNSMLPPAIAAELKTGAVSTAMDYPMVTILFSDIRGFTTICNSCNPFQVVGMLNELYTLFDDKSEYHNVYKVETIGDAYMVAAGLLDTAKEHTEAVVNMAFSMREDAGSVLEPVNKIPLQIRIGLHSGPVVAGVVGKRMPRFCLFGDTVNTASRMESHGVPGKIHLSGSAYNEIKDKHFRFYSRGYINVKGLGLRETYLVEHVEEGGEPGLEYLPDAIRSLETVASPEKKAEVQSPAKETSSDQKPPIDNLKPSNEPTSNQIITDNQKPISKEPALDEDTSSPDQRPKPDGTSPEHSTTMDPRPVPDRTSPEHPASLKSTPDHTLEYKNPTLEDPISIQSLSPASSETTETQPTLDDPIPIQSLSTTSPERTTETQPTLDDPIPIQSLSPASPERTTETQPTLVTTQSPVLVQHAGLAAPNVPGNLIPTPAAAIQVVKPYTESAAISAAFAPNNIPTPGALKPCRVKLPPLNRPQINTAFPAEEPNNSSLLAATMVKPHSPDQAWTSHQKATSTIETEEETGKKAVRRKGVAAEHARPHEVPSSPPRDHLVEVKTRKCTIS